MASADFTPSTSFAAPGSTPSTPAASQSDAGTLQANLQKLAARRNAVRLWHSLATSLSWGLGIAALMIVAYRFYLVDGPVWLPAIPIVISLLIGWRSGVLARASTFAAALEADEKLELRERLSSGLAFAFPDAVSRTEAAPIAGGVLPRLRALIAPPLVTQNAVPVAQTVLVPSLVQDAARHSQTLEPKMLYPLRFDRTHRVLAMCLALFLVATLMPNVPWLLSPAEATQRKNIAAQGEELVEVAKEVKKDEPKEIKSDAESKRLARKMEALGLKMQRGRMSKKEALTSLGELKKDLEKAAKNNDGENDNSGSSMQSMAQALEQLADQPMESETGQKLQDAAKKGDAEAAAKEMEKLADKIEKGEMSADEKQKAANDLQKMADQLKKQGGQQDEDMANQLEQAAQALKQQAQQEKQGGQKQGQQDQKQGQGQQSQAQQGQNKQGQSKSGQSQQSQGGQSQNGQQKGSGQGMSNSLRQMAKSLRQGGSGSNSQGLQRMLNKIRQAERDTGMNNSGQSGMQFKNGKMGDECPGGNCNGNGVIPGKDLKAMDPHGPVGGGAGLGPRNNATGSKSGGGVSKDKSKRTGDKRRWEDVWSDRLPATRKKIDRVQGKYQDDGEMEQLPTKTEAKGGPVKTPYYEVYESYQKDAEDAVNKETVPPAYKQPVKDYFESIKPN